MLKPYPLIIVVSNELKIVGGVSVLNLIAGPFQELVSLKLKYGIVFRLHISINNLNFDLVLNLILVCFLDLVFA